MGLKHLINEPTRTQNGSETLIDHLWATENCHIAETGVIPGLSDHHGIFAVITNKDKNPEEEVTCRSYRHYNKEKAAALYQQLIEESTFQNSLADQCLDSALKTWLDTTIKVCDTVAPKKSFTKKEDRKHIPWFTSEIVHLINIKNSYVDAYRKTRNRALQSKLRKISNKLKNLKKKHKKAYYAAKIEQQEKDPKKLWQILKESTNNTKQKEEVEPDNVNKATANAFNSYFASVGKAIQKRLNIPETSFPIAANRDLKEGFSFRPENSESTAKLIKGLKPTVVTGHCGIPARIFIDLAKCNIQ